MLTYIINKAKRSSILFDITENINSICCNVRWISSRVNVWRRKSLDLVKYAAGANKLHCVNIVINCVLLLDGIVRKPLHFK